MHSKIFFALGLLCVVARAQNIDCNCGLGSGYEVCNPDPSPLVVRPVPLPSLPDCRTRPIPGLVPLKPIGDLCSCSETLVYPALVPRPPCAQCGTCGLLSPPAKVASDYLPPEKKPLAPADPVSLDLAKLLYKTVCNVPEDRLAFGFKTLPKEVECAKKEAKTEENLFQINGEIVELKPAPCRDFKTLDEEAVEELLLEQEEDDDEVPLNFKLSLGEIGYGPAKCKPQNFISVDVADPPTQPRSPICCNDGFVPGRVVINDVPVTEQFNIPSAPEPICDDEEDESAAEPDSYAAYSIPVPKPCLPPSFLQSLYK